MAKVSDNWWKTVKDADGKPRKVRSANYGKGKRWRARWYNQDGKQCEENFKTYDEAKGRAATAEADLRRMTYIDPQAGKVRFRAFAEEWRLSQSHEPQTVTIVEQHFRLHVYPFLGELELAAIKPSRAQAWVRALETGRDGRPPLAAGTIHTIHRWVTAVFLAAIVDKRIAENPVKDVKWSSSSGRRANPPTPEQADRMRTMLPPRLQGIAAMGAGLGARQGEAFAIEVDAIDFDKKEVEIRQQVVRVVGGQPVLRLPKGRKVRRVPLADAPAALLRAHMREYPPVKVWIEDQTNPTKPVWRWAELVFTMADGTALHRISFGKVWRTARRRAEVADHLTFHYWRHWFASALIRFGESVLTVQSALGHATAQQTLDTYGHLWPDAADRTRAAIDSAFPRQVGREWGDPELDVPDQRGIAA